jgi:uncharacterized protein (TIGR02391 family)
VIALLPEQVVALPIDRLGIAILEDLKASSEWNEHNYLVAAQQGPFRGESLHALAEAMTWLRARGLIARTPEQSSSDAIFITRAGHRALAEGVLTLDATERLQAGTHPQILAKARPQFLLGEYEQGVFSSMKAVEVRVRKLARLGADAVGVELINRAFGMGGPLVDASVVKGEQEGTRALFAGAYAVLRNPTSHREVNFEDVNEAAEMIHTASLLMRILDRVEKRLTATYP